jgi:hypothetical protein
MNRICIYKPTNKLIEFQSGGAPLGTLLANAINGGYDENEIEELYTELVASQAISTYESPEQKTAREDREAREGLKVEATSRDKVSLGLQERVERLEDILGV